MNLEQKRTNRPILDGYTISTGLHGENERSNHTISDLIHKRYISGIVATSTY